MGKGCIVKYPVFNNKPNYMKRPLCLNSYL